MSYLSWEVFKHGVLCWAGADPGDLRESFLSQGLCRYPTVSFSWGRQGRTSQEHCSPGLHGLTPARLRCADGEGGTWLFCLSVLYPALGLPIRSQGPLSRHLCCSVNIFLSPSYISWSRWGHARGMHSHFSVSQDSMQEKTNKLLPHLSDPREFLNLSDFFIG